MNTKIIFTLVLTLILGVVQIIHAQQATRVYRIDYLSVGSGKGPGNEALRQDLRERGYIEGQNLVIEWRFAEGKLDRLPGLVADLVRLKVDMIVVSSTQAALLAKEATQSIPIVFAIAEIL